MKSIRDNLKNFKVFEKENEDNFDKIKKGQLNKVSEDNTLFSRKISKKKFNQKPKKSEVSTSACSERK